MKKSDKKTDKLLRQALTEICEKALDEVAGFKWLTHSVNYADFPNSLVITCMFDTEDEHLAAQACGDDQHLRSLIEDKLAKVEIKLKQAKRQVCFEVIEH